MKARRTLLAAVMYAVLTAIALIMMYPFIWAVTASFKMNTQIFNGNPFDLIPEPFTLQNYARAWTVLPFYRFMLNSLVLSIIVPTCIIILASLSAYAFARLNFKGRDAVFMCLLGVMMMPGHITLIPNYSLMRMLGWINDYKALIIPMIFQGSLVFNIFFMRQYFLSIPKELDEAAIIDGCSRFGVWWRIMMPNARPAIATIAILSFVSEWNTFLWPVIVINDYLKMPIQVGVSYFKANVNDWGVLMAATSMAIVPLIVVFAVFQNYFIKSMLTSGLSGK